jgi:sugar lactone lactonase YvrE
MKQVLTLLVLTLVLLLSACSSPGPSSLQITLSAPSGGSPSVLVLGPDNFRQTLSATTTLSPLTPGKYFLLPQAYRSSSGPIVDTAFGADPQTVAVSGSSQATVSYALTPGSGKLWTGMDFIQSGEPLILGYSSASLGSSSPSRSTSIRLGQDASVDSPNEMAFDGGGNLWVVSRRRNQLVQYSVSQLGSANPSLKPFRVLSSSDFNGPTGLAFDSEGGLWVSNNGGRVVHFSTDGLAFADSSLSADRTLRGFINPAGMAFDTSGNLWIADSASSREQVFGFGPGKIASSGTPTPDFTLTGGTATSPIGPRVLAFDPDGNLWVSTNTHLFRYAKNALSDPAAQPNVQLSPSTTATNVFAGMAFDNAGNLWATNFDGATSTLMMFSPNSQLTGKVTPNRIIGGPELLHPPYGLAFAPTSSNVPIR